jgi:hypothetical protein
MAHHPGDVEGALAGGAPKAREGVPPAHQARQGFGFDMTRGAAHAAHPHQKLPEAVVELLE